MKEEHTAQDIARINDKLRAGIPMMPRPHRVLMTCGVADLGEIKVAELLTKVANFSEFNSDNDPYFEHDMGWITMDGQKYMWKFDYFDDSFEYFQKNGNRVLTVMRTDEY